MTIKYHFPIEVYFKNKKIEDLSDMFNKYWSGDPVAVSLVTDMGNFTLSVSGDGSEDPPPVSGKKLEKIQQLLQEELDSIFKDDPKFTFKVGEAVLIA
jgi:AAA+ ATPase superfamily predicted ATPase